MAHNVFLRYDWNIAVMIVLVLMWRWIKGESTLQE